jgi:hypothetical protein
LWADSELAAGRRRDGGETAARRRRTARRRIILPACTPMSMRRGRVAAGLQAGRSERAQCKQVHHNGTAPGRRRGSNLSHGPPWYGPTRHAHSREATTGPGSRARAPLYIRAPMLRNFFSRRHARNGVAGQCECGGQPNHWRRARECSCLPCSGVAVASKTRAVFASPCTCLAAHTARGPAQQCAVDKNCTAKAGGGCELPLPLRPAKIAVLYAQTQCVGGGGGGAANGQPKK